MTPSVVRKARPSEWAAIAETLTDALSEDPFFLWLVDAGVMADPKGYFLREVNNAIARRDRIDTTDGHESAAIWMPPRMREIDARMPELVKEVLNEIDSTHPKEDHAYLAWIGTRRADQGRAFGTAVIRRGLERLDKKGRSAALWTANEVSRLFFERHGFRVVAEVRPKSAPKSWWLWRGHASPR